MIDDTDDMDTLRERVRKQYGDGSDLPAPITSVQIDRGRRSGKTKAAADALERSRNGKTKAGNAAAAAKRVGTGLKFESELDDTHNGMLQRGLGYIIPHYPPTQQIGAGKRILKKGGGPCDYSGHVNAGKFPRLLSVQIPVVFDAKVLGDGHATYKHDVAQQHQLHQLKNAASAGAAAFLLVRADSIGRVFLIGWHEHGAQLLRGDGVRLFEKIRAGWETETRLGRSTQVPAYTVQACLPCVDYTPGRGWLWHELLQYVDCQPFPGGELKAPGTTS